jgi:hypothetical protein
MPVSIFTALEKVVMLFPSFLISSAYYYFTLSCKKFINIFNDKGPTQCKGSLSGFTYVSESHHHT